MKVRHISKSTICTEYGMRNHRKGQIATEFIFYIGMSIFIGIVGTVVISQVYETKSNEYSLVHAKAYADRLRTEIELAARVQDGYMRTFTLEQTLNNYPVSINVTSDGFIVVDYFGHSVYVPTVQIEGDLVYGMNTIEKIDGKIVVNQ